MNFSRNDDLKSMLRPYLFVLKEGKKIKKDPLDYSLLMLQVGCVETIHSPGNPARINPFAPIATEVSPQEAARRNLVGS